MSLTREKAQLMSASEIDRTLVRLAHEVLEKTEDLGKLAFIGIRRRGVPLAQRIARKIGTLESLEVPVGILDINLYRDDLSTVGTQPVVNGTEIDFPVTGKDIILFDDVLYTGRTVRAALDALFDHGRPARVQLCVLIDRGHRELPVEARYIGRMVQTTGDEIIEVKFQEIDGLEKVLLVEKVGLSAAARRACRFQNAARAICTRLSYALDTAGENPCRLLARRPGSDPDRSLRHLQPAVALCLRRHTGADQSHHPAARQCLCPSKRTGGLRERIHRDRRRSRRQYLPPGTRQVG